MIKKGATEESPFRERIPCGGSTPGGDKALDAQKMLTDENSSGALGAGEHGGGSHQLQSPGSNPLGVGQGGNAAEGYVAKYAAKEDTKVNRSLSGREMLN